MSNMKVNSLGKNKTVIEYNGGTRAVFFSYKTPVAALTENGFVQTEKSWSVTTKKHINSWLRDEGQNPADVNTVPQDMLDNLLDVK